MESNHLGIFLVLVYLIVSFSHAKEYKPESAQEFQAALNSANPGDTIQLQAMDYVGDFVMQRSGDKYHAIQIFGTENDDGSAATGIIGNTTSLFLKGDHIKLKTLNITGIEEGLYLEGNHNSAESLAFYNLKQAILVEGTNNVFGSISLSDLEDAIHVRGSDNQFRDISCNNATSGMIVDGDRTKLHNLAFHDAEGKIFALELNGCCSRLSNTIWDGLVEIKGDRNHFRQTIANGAINILGCNNNFGRNVFGRTYFTKECENKLVSSNIHHFPQEKPTTLQTL